MNEARLVFISVPYPVWCLVVIQVRLVDTMRLNIALGTELDQRIGFLGTLRRHEQKRMWVCQQDDQNVPLSTVSATVSLFLGHEMKPREGPLVVGTILGMIAILLVSLYLCSYLYLSPCQPAATHQRKQQTIPSEPQSSPNLKPGYPFDLLSARAARNLPRPPK